MDVKLRAVLIFGMVANILGWRPFIVKLLNETHQVLHADIVDLNVTQKNQSFISVNLNMKRDISQLFMDLEVTFDPGDGTYNLVYMNKTVDLCTFLNNRKSNAILDISYRILSAYGNLPKTCPVQKRLYQLGDVFIDPEKFPPLMPNHNLRMVGIMWNKDKNKKIVLLDLKLYLVIERSFKNNKN